MHSIYIITNLINSKIYIGQTFDLKARWIKHKLLSEYSDACPKLYRAMRKYGIDKFSFNKIQGCDSQEYANEVEEFYIKFLDSIVAGYNIRTGGKVSKGWHPSEATKLKMVIAATGRIMSPESIEKTRQANLGRTPHNKGKFGYHTAPIVTCANDNCDIQAIRWIGEVKYCNKHAMRLRKVKDIG